MQFEIFLVLISLWDLSSRRRPSRKWTRCRVSHTHHRRSNLGGVGGRVEAVVVVVAVVVAAVVAAAVARTFIASVRTLRRRPCKEHFLPSTGRVKVIRINSFSEHDIVVQVQKLAADARDAVQV